MTMYLRQVCLVAQKLEPAIVALTSVLGIERCHVDPGVGKWGLENTLMAVGTNFLEVVAPIDENTAGGRYLDRRVATADISLCARSTARYTRTNVAVTLPVLMFASPSTVIEITII